MRLSRQSLITGGVLVWSLLGLATSGAAQDKPSESMSSAREKLASEKKEYVTQHLKLTDAEAKNFWPVYESYQNKLGVINDRLVKLIQSYAAHYADMTDEVAKQLVDESLSIDADRLKIRQTFLPQFRKILPEVKVARYYQIENKIQSAMNYDLSTGIHLME
ncbi:MAG: hypothetical protein U0V70_10300 [Terriglobia bacterium]